MFEFQGIPRKNKSLKVEIHHCLPEPASYLLVIDLLASVPGFCLVPHIFLTLLTTPKSENDAHHPTDFSFPLDI